MATQQSSRAGKGTAASCAAHRSGLNAILAGLYSPAWHQRPNRCYGRASSVYSQWLRIPRGRSSSACRCTGQAQVPWQVHVHLCRPFRGLVNSEYGRRTPAVVGRSANIPQGPLPVCRSVHSPNVLGSHDTDDFRKGCRVPHRESGVFHR